MLYGYQHLPLATTKKICNLQKNICYENNKMCTFGLLYHS